MSVHPLPQHAETPPPEHLSDRAQGYWRSIVAGWELEPHQLELLRRLCEAMDRADECRVILAGRGLTTEDRYGQVKPHPLVNVERDCRIGIARLTRELNLADSAEGTRPPRGRGRK